MAGIEFKDLDFDYRDPESLERKELHEARSEIRATRERLGKFTVRDTMEAVYGEAYTKQVLGEHGGEDVLMEEMNPFDDIREMKGEARQDVGGNRLPTTKLSGGDRADAASVLSKQEAVADAGISESLDRWISEDSTSYKAKKVAEDIHNMLPEERAEMIRLLQEKS